MAKKKIMNNNTASYCNKNVWMLVGIVLIILGVGLYLEYLSLERVIAMVLILFGIKKVFMAAKCC